VRVPGDLYLMVGRHRNMGQVLGGGGAVWLSGYSGEMDKTDPGCNENHEINSS
jgi:hypothetical protein